MIKNLVLKYEIYDLRFAEKLFFRTNLGFSPYRDYRSYENEYYSEKNRHLSITNKIHLKCDVIDVSVLNSVRQPLLYSFVLDKPAGYKLFCELETTNYKKLNKSVLNTINLF